MEAGTGIEITLTAKQIADMKGITVQAVHKLGKKEGWQYKTVNGRGKPRKEYLFSSLPGEIQNLYLIYKGRGENQGSGVRDQGENQGSGVRDQGENQGSGVRDQGENQGSGVRDQGANLPVRVDNLIGVPGETDEKNDPWLSLPESVRESGYRILQTVNHARDIKERTKKGKTKALKLYAAREEISYATLARHIKKADRALVKANKSGADTIYAQIKALTYKYGANKNTVRSFDEAAIMFAWSQYCTQKHLNLSDVYEETINTAYSAGWKTGSYDSLVRIINKMDPATRTRSRKGERRFEADHLKKIVRNYEEIWSNFQWCGDHHIFDVFVKLPDGKGGWTFKRPWLTAWMDMASRSIMGWVISFNPNSRCIAMALAHGIKDKNDPNFPQHGLPSSVYIDNGKDYRAKYLNGEEIKIGKIDYPDIIEKYAALGIEPFYIDLEYDPDQDAWVKKRGKKNITIKGIRVGGVYARLSISQHYARAYHPWAKPIERMFRNVVQGFSRHLPGWCGSGHDQRPEKLNFELKRGTVLTLDEFCDAWYGWVTNKYHKQKHTGHGMNGMSPDQAFKAKLQNPTKVSPQLLDFALLKKDRVKMYNWGFNLNGRQYEPDLPVNLHGGNIANHIIGEWVQIYHDYDHKTVRIYKDGEYLCNGKPLDRASFMDPDNPVMVDGLRMQAYQTKAAKAVMAAVNSHPAASAGVSETGELLRLSAGEEEQGQGQGSGVGDQGSEAEVIPITRDERYRQILKKVAGKMAISEKDRVFQEDFEKTQEYMESADLYRAEFEYMEYQANGS